MESILLNWKKSVGRYFHVDVISDGRKEETKNKSDEEKERFVLLSLKIWKEVYPAELVIR